MSYRENLEFLFTGQAIDNKIGKSIHPHLSKAISKVTVKQRLGAGTLDRGIDCRSESKA